MAHAFRSAALIEAENAQRKVERLRDRWSSTRDTWFDGSPASVDRRIAQADEVISFTKHIGSRLNQSSIGMTCLAMLPQLRADREGLEAMRERLLTGAEEESDGDNEGRHRHEDLGFSSDDVQRLKDRQAAQEFIETQNTTDRQELLIRAQRLVETRTATWAPQASESAVRDFLGAVDAQIPRQERHTQRVASADTVNDFADSLLFS